jgi:predicted Fe-Mo cluster-binding NifX family protein
MKIIATVKPAYVQSTVNGSFGKCRYYIVYDGQ